MSQAVIFDTLTQDDALNDLGIDDKSVFPNYSFTERPRSTKGVFIILRWEEEPVAFSRVRGPRVLTIWVHSVIENGIGDFTPINQILDAVDDAILDPALQDTVGTDGYTLTCVRATGRGGDMEDDGFKTLTRNSAYEVLARRTA
jgi:hypothetical protein